MHAHIVSLSIANCTLPLRRKVLTPLATIVHWEAFNWVVNVPSNKQKKEGNLLGSRKKNKICTKEWKVILPQGHWTGARLIAVMSLLLGQQQQFHPFSFQRGAPFFTSSLVGDPLQSLSTPLQTIPSPLQPRDPLSSFRHAMPANCQSEYFWWW